MALSGTQNLLDGVTFPSFRMNGFENITNGVTFPPATVTGLSASSLKQGVTAPSVPAVATPESSDSSVNWLWLLVVIPIGIAGAAAMSKPE
jgi:hypothetical protein